MQVGRMDDEGGTTHATQFTGWVGEETVSVENRSIHRSIAFGKQVSEPASAPKRRGVGLKTYALIHPFQRADGIQLSIIGIWRN